MRDHPTVPNVFRVASTHSINSISTLPTPRSSSNQQQQQQQQHCNSIIKYKQSNSYEQQQQQQQPQQLVSYSAQYSRSNSYEQQQQQQQQQHADAQQQLGKHQLTTSASIEHSYPPQQQQQSPYATLPRGCLKRTPQQQQQLQLQQQQQTGVINTISGSIPVTGFGSISSLSDLQFNNVQLNNNSSNSNTNNNNNNINSSSNNNANETRQQQQRQQRTVTITTPTKEAAAATVADNQSHVVDTMNNDSISNSNNISNNNNNNNKTGKVNASGKAKSGYLWLLTPVAASISVAIVIAALAGPQWLYTEEKLPNAKYNGTPNFKALDDGVYLTKYTKSSLWILCTTLPGKDVDTYNCVKIDYFPQEGYQPDPHDSTPAIPYTVTKSCPIFLGAGIVLVISFIIFLIPTCSHRNSLYYFTAGILFIVSGLIMLIGLIAYISILKAEIGSKLRPRSPLQPALFKVTYGQSFFLFVFGFIATEFVGVLNIFLYIHLQEFSYYSRLPCFSVANIHAKIQEEQSQQQHARTHSYKRYRQPGNAAALASSEESLNASAKQQQQSRDPLQPQHQQQEQLYQQFLLRSMNARLHQVHDAARGPLPATCNTQTLPGGYACRKHPNAAAAPPAAAAAGGGGGSNLNLYLHNDLERRFFFEKPAVSKCNLHSRSFAKSLNELCMEPTPAPAATRLPLHATLPLPAPPATFADLPQEFPLTRSVSTATDIFNPSAQLQRKQQRNMATNTQHLPRNRGEEHDEEDDDMTEARLCGLKRGLRKTKDELFNEFCKRAGMRAKPKNIYYIPSEDSVESPEPPLPSHSSKRRSHEENSHDRSNNNNDDDADGDDNGFRQFRSPPGVTLDGDHLYVVTDPGQFTMPRRSSMCVDPMPAMPMPQLRKLNSNLSLHTPQSEIWPWASQQRLASEHGQSRTLPRCFMRQPAGSQDSLGSLQSSFSASQQRFTQLMQQHQQQLQQQNRYLSTLTLPLPLPPRPNEDLLPASKPQASKSGVQWPAAIPSSPSNYGHGSSANANIYHHPQPLYVANNAAPPVVSAQVHPPKFQRAYAFDDAQRRASFAVSDAFDLDELERERRRSHASLFTGINMPQSQQQSQSQQTQSQYREVYDVINGTAV